jgi:hypothetical protein
MEISKSIISNMLLKGNQEIQEDRRQMTDDGPLNKKLLRGVQMLHGACFTFSRKEPPWSPKAKR